jgi:hypothetical protein
MLLYWEHAVRKMSVVGNGDSWGNAGVGRQIKSHRCVAEFETLGTSIGSERC